MHKLGYYKNTEKEGHTKVANGGLPLLLAAPSMASDCNSMTGVWEEEEVGVVRC